MAWYLTSAFKEPKKVAILEYVPEGYYKIYDPELNKDYIVPFDQLEERSNIDDLL